MFTGPVKLFGQADQSSNKQICHFYQRGNCKYGNNCWNLHTNANRPKSATGSFSSFGNANLQEKDSQFSDFVKQVATEMTTWEKSGMWLLSCLAPLKEHPLLKGFLDTSPEELRVSAYEALKSNNTAAYETEVKEKLLYHECLRQALKSQLPEAVEVLKSVFYNKSSGSLFGGSGSTDKPSLLDGASSGQKSLFGGSAAAPSSLFSGAKKSSSAFGAPSLFGSGFSNNSFKRVFGGQSSSTSVFGGAAEQNLFGSTQTQPSLFSAPAPAHPQSSVFGASVQPSTAQSSVFGSATQSSAFGGQTQLGRSLFGNTVQPQQNQSAFGSNQNSSVFGAATQNSSVFGTATQNSSTFGTSNQNQANFGTASQNTSVFGTASQNPSAFGTVSTQNQSVFGNGTQNQQNQSAFGAASQSQSNVFGFSQPQQGQSSLFGGGGGQSLLGAPPGGQSLLGAPPGGQSLLGAPPGGQSLLGAPPGGGGQSLLGAPPALSQANSLFGGASFASPQPASSFLMANSTPFQSSNVFAQAATNSTQTGPTASQDSSGSWFAPAADNGIANPATSSQAAVSASGFAPAATSTVTTNNVSRNGPQNSLERPPGQIYTPLHILSQEDREEFEREVFYRIPLVPPPRELCA